MIVVVCPGQGSQTPGFLEPWIADPGSKALLETLSAAADVDLVKHGTVSDANLPELTQVAARYAVAIDDDLAAVSKFDFQHTAGAFELAAALGQAHVSQLARRALQRLFHPFAPPLLHARLGTADG